MILTISRHAVRSSLEYDPNAHAVQLEEAGPETVPLAQGSHTETMASPTSDDLTLVPAGHATSFLAPFIAPGSTKSAPTWPGDSAAHAATQGTSTAPHLTTKC